MEEKWNIKTSGEQQVFDTGAKRDSQKGKGRFDLIPFNALKSVAEQYGKKGKNVDSSIFDIGKAIELLHICVNKVNTYYYYISNAAEAVYYILEFMETDDIEYTDDDNSTHKTTRYDLIPYSSLKRVAELYEKGAKTYGERNWEKGMPLTRYIDSAIRHLLQFVSGKDDEDHLAAGVWNALGFIETAWKISCGYLSKELDNRVELEFVEKTKDIEYKEEFEEEFKEEEEKEVNSPDEFDITISTYGSILSYNKDTNSGEILCYLDGNKYEFSSESLLGVSKNINFQPKDKIEFKLEKKNEEVKIRNIKLNWSS